MSDPGRLGSIHTCCNPWCGMRGLVPPFLWPSCHCLFKLFSSSRRHPAFLPTFSWPHCEFQLSALLSEQQIRVHSCGCLIFGFRTVCLAVACVCDSRFCADHWHSSVMTISVVDGHFFEARNVPLSIQPMRFLVGCVR